MTIARHLLVPVLLIGLVATACGGGGGEPAAEAAPPDDPGASEPAGVRVVTPDEGAAILADAPSDLVVLDVRTPEEHDEAHIAGAVLLDIYEPDFADRVDELDRAVPYLLYCRSGNRSEAARTLMDELGFLDVADVAGGITAWVEAGHPVVAR